jgi:hypothetical protein
MLGDIKSRGHVDFYPNKGTNQPRCGNEDWFDGETFKSGENEIN